MDESLDRSLAERLGRLERECRRWRLIGGGIVSAGAVMLIAGGASRDDGPNHLQADRFTVGELEAKRLVLKDENGKPWFTLERRDGVAQMLMEGAEDAVPQGRPEDGGKGDGHRTQGGQGAEKSGPARLLFVVNRGGVPYISINGNERGATLIGVNPTGEPYLSVSGKDGSATLGGKGDAGSPALMMWDREGRERVRFGLRPDGTAAVEVVSGTAASRQQGKTRSEPAVKDGPKPGDPAASKP